VLGGHLNGPELPAFEQNERAGAEPRLAQSLRGLTPDMVSRMTSDPGQLLRDVRTRHGLDQRTLARRAGTSQVQISRIERAQTSPTVETLARLLAVMGERLVLHTEQVRGNRSTAELRSDFDELSPEQRVAQAAALSRSLTGIAARRPS
jgi:transcriptional regulator with XRE-family HTH domain